MLSKRIQKLEESGIRKFFSMTAKNKGEYINLSIGQPHFSTPEKLKVAAKKAIDNNFNAYTQTSGTEKLKEQIIEKLQKQNNIDAKENEVMITAGASGAIFLALSAILDRGDEIIIPDPHFVLYKQVAEFLEAKPVFLDTYPDFHIKKEKLEDLVTPKTKVIFINSPNNPTGVVYSKEEIENIVEVAKKNNLIIISDEIYEKFDYEGKFFSPGSIYKNTITLNGFSKSHFITGWRVGFAHGPSEIIDAMCKLQQYTFICAPSLAQVALAEEFDSHLEENIKQYKRNRDFVYESLKDKYDIQKTEGAIFYFVPIPKNKDNFINDCLEKKLLVVPGSVFSKKNSHFRLSFAAQEDILQKGIEILKELA